MSIHDEAKHPRDRQGQWANKSGAAADAPAWVSFDQDDPAYVTAAERTLDAEEKVKDAATDLYDAVLGFDGRSGASVDAEGEEPTLTYLHEDREVSVSVAELTDAKTAAALKRAGRFSLWGSQVNGGGHEESTDSAAVKKAARKYDREEKKYEKSITDADAAFEQEMREQFDSTGVDVREVRWHLDAEGGVRDVSASGPQGAPVDLDSMTLLDGRGHATVPARDWLLAERERPGDGNIDPDEWRRVLGDRYATKRIGATPDSDDPTLF